MTKGNSHITSPAPATVMPAWVMFAFRLLLFALISFLLLWFTAYDSSPRSPISGHDYDMFVMGGEIIRQGKALYTDYFDNKGPYLFLINALGLTISSGKWGIFILEIFNLTLSLTLLDIISRRIGLSIRSRIFAFSAAILWLGCTIGGGDTVELWSLPYVLLALLFPRRWLICGICFGVISMLRINNAAIIVGIVIWGTVMMLKQCQFKQLIKSGLYFLLGIAIAIAPAFIWMATEGALDDMIYSIFIYALHYKDPSGWHGWHSLLTCFIFLIPCLIAPIVAKHTDTKIQGLSTLIILISVTTFVTFISGYPFAHYFLLEVPIVFITIAYLTENTRNWIKILLIAFLPTFAFGIYNRLDDFIDTETSSGFKNIKTDSCIDYDSVYQLELPSALWGYVYRSSNGASLPVGRYISQQGFHDNTDPQAHDRIIASFIEANPKYVISGCPMSLTLLTDLEPNYALIDKAIVQGYTLLIYRRL